MSTFIDDFFQGSNTPQHGMIEFKSTDHIRYANGIDISGHNYNCKRRIRIENNISGNEGYTVTIFNDDGINPLWGSNVQMAPKQMKIIKCHNGVIKLQGFGYNSMGSPFSEYGITIIFRNNEIDSCTLHMLDRNVDIEYLK